MREIERDGVVWTIREMNSSRHPGSRAATCLIFECEGVVRRVWEFPVYWADLHDDAVWSLLDLPALPPRTAPSTTSTITKGTAGAMDAAYEVTERTRTLLQEVARWRAANNALRTERVELLARCNALRDEMRNSVSAYAVSLRAGGVPPERAIVLLKIAVHDAVSAFGDATSDTDQVLHDGIDWAIDAYYAA